MRMVSLPDDHKLFLEYLSSLQEDHPALSQKDPSLLDPRLLHSQACHWMNYKNQERKSYPRTSRFNNPTQILGLYEWYFKQNPKPVCLSQTKKPSVLDQYGILMVDILPSVNPKQAIDDWIWFGLPTLLF